MQISASPSAIEHAVRRLRMAGFQEGSLAACIIGLVLVAVGLLVIGPEHIKELRFGAGGLMVGVGLRFLTDFARLFQPLDPAEPAPAAKESRPEQVALKRLMPPSPRNSNAR